MDTGSVEWDSDFVHSSYNKSPPATSTGRGISCSPTWGRFRGANNGCRLGDDLVAQGQRRGFRAGSDAQLGKDVADVRFG